MTTTTTPDMDAAGRRYLDEAANGLDDLPLREREELLSDIADAIAELGDVADYDDLTTRLGRPSEFVREIRVSSGARGRAERVTAVGQDEPPLFDRWFHAGVAGLRWIGREMEPVWWIVRGLVVLALLLGWWGRPYVDELVVMTLVVVSASLAVGARSRVKAGRTGRRDNLVLPRGIATVVLGVVAVMMLATYASAYDNEVVGGAVVGSGPMDEGAVTVGGVAASNLYAFDAEGNRLSGVRIFDQDGRRLQVWSEVGPDMDPSASGTALGLDLFDEFPVDHSRPVNGGAPVTGQADGWPASPGPVEPAAAADPEATSGSEVAPGGLEAAAEGADSTPVPPAEPVG